MGKKHTFEYVKEYVESNGYILLSTEYKNSASTLKSICPEGHYYNFPFNRFFSGFRCPTCYNIRRRHSIDYIKNLYEANGFELLEFDYKNFNTKLIAKCLNGHSTKRSPNEISQGRINCIVCLENEILNNQIIKIENRLLINNYSWIDGEYKNANSKIKIKCDNNHEYEVSASSFIEGYKCKQCAVDNRKIDFNIIKSFIENENYTLLDDTYIHQFKPLNLICSKGHNATICFNNFKDGHRCRQCYIDDRVISLEEWLSRGGSEKSYNKRRSFQNTWSKKYIKEIKFVSFV